MVEAATFALGDSEGEGKHRMRALRFGRFGDVSVLQIKEVPVPIPGPGEVLVKVHAASINPSDVKNVQGKMEGTILPRTPAGISQEISLTARMNSSDKKYGVREEMSDLLEREAMQNTSSYRKPGRG